MILINKEKILRFAYRWALELSAVWCAKTLEATRIQIPQVLISHLQAGVP